jgi:putative MATE family efflux protein
MQTEQVDSSQSDKLGSQPIVKLIVNFFLPSLAGLMAYAFYSIADRYFLGIWAGAEGLSAVTVVFPLMLIIYGIVFLSAGGSSTLISIYLGEGEKRKAEHVFANSMTLIFIIGLMVTFGGLWFAEDILRLIGVGDDIMPTTLKYLQIIFIGVTPMAVGFSMDFTIRSEGFPVYCVLIMAFSAVLNVILDPIFIKVLGMGAEGAAIATIISQASTVFMGAYHYIWGKTQLKFTLRDFVPDIKLCGKIMMIGMPLSIMEASFGLQSSVVVNQIFKYGGASAVAAMGVIVAVETFATLPVFALADGLQPIIGYNFGAKKCDRVKQTINIAAFLLAGWAILVIAFVYIAGGFVAEMFLPNNPEAVAITQRGLNIYMIGFPAFSFTMLSIRYFQSVGSAKLANAMVILKTFLIYIPVLIVLGKILGLDGVWIAEPAGGTLTAVIVLVFLYFQVKRLENS